MFHSSVHFSGCDFLSEGVLSSVSEVNYVVYNIIECNMSIGHYVVRIICPRFLVFDGSPLFPTCSKNVVTLSPVLPIRAPPCSLRLEFPL